MSTTLQAQQQLSTWICPDRSYCCAKPTRAKPRQGAILTLLISALNLATSKRAVPGGGAVSQCVCWGEGKVVGGKEQVLRQGPESLLSCSFPGITGLYIGHREIWGKFVIKRKTWEEEEKKLRGQSEKRMGICGLTKAGTTEFQVKQLSFRWPQPVQPLQLANTIQQRKAGLGWRTLSPFLKQENNRSAFLSSSCNLESPHKEEEGGKGNANTKPRHSLGDGDFNFP